MSVQFIPLLIVFHAGGQFYLWLFFRGWGIICSPLVFVLGTAPHQRKTM